MRKEKAFASLLAVFVNQGNSCFAQRYADGYRSILLCFSLDILDGVTDDISVSHFEQVADTASDKAMKDENIPLRFYLFIARQIGFEQLRPLFIGYVNGRSVHDFTDGEMLERIVRRVAVVDRPQNKRSKTGKQVGNRIQPSQFRQPFRNFVTFLVQYGRSLALRGFDCDLCRIGILFVYLRIVQECRSFIE